MPIDHFEHSGDFPLLFSPLEIGPVTLANRIVNAPHQTGFVRDNRITDQLLAYHRERARGGAALIMSQANSVVPGYLDLQNVSDEIIADYRAATAAVAEFGAHYGVELYHPGSQGNYTGDLSEVYVGPSGVPSAYFHSGWRVPHAMTEAEILGIVESFAEAARRCREAGVGVVEIHLAHGNLIEQFISTRTNHRVDDWGGPLENRLRFAEHVLRAVRTAVGPNVAVGARMTATGLDPQDPGPLDAAEIIGTVGSWELLDYVSLTMGRYSDALNTSRNVPNMSYPPGTWQKYGRAIRSVLEIPTILAGRVNHPRVAEDMLESGSCDAVAMVRALIADPELPRKAQQGEVDRIRPCVGAMNCLHRLDQGRGIRCIHNPAVGHEANPEQDLRSPGPRRRVLVVGGGPAGLEFARVAAESRHDVTLFERSRIGGQAITASKPPTRSELAEIVTWLSQECQTLGVDVRTGITMSRKYIDDFAPDVVAIATGSRFQANPFAGGPMRTIEPGAVLSSTERFEGTIAVYDTFGDWHGLGVAHSLASRGADVVYVSPTPYPGSALELTNWRIEYAKLAEAGVQFHPITEVTGVDHDSLRVRRGFSSSETSIGGIDALVWVAPPEADDTLFRTLNSDAFELHLIGDAYAPRGIEQAIHDARIAAQSI
ncbi:FAD-dependent oxidoreductase [Hoyosella sp. YIM 151337]|uniref:oxidoreductase n=1 Tax=Hoyosella sp. YIM 151337 TaxID=2992742 RepID=UPI002235560E|nr:FAD-dependent oxidoreductase [Hoyosella sp. YIM 151337]MCW4355211.1 FAD-dependent oxidoreductase [Hoyosella sp. YIM 151337]